MNKRGFTLIELLAVIVILAIIALIATPIVLGIIEDARESSNERSVELYADAVKQAVARYQITNPTTKVSGTFTGSNNGRTLSNGELSLTVDYNGAVECDVIEMSEKGSLTLNECKVNGGTINYSYDEEKGVTSGEGNPSTDDDQVPKKPNVEALNITVYFDVYNGVLCDKSMYEASYDKGINDYTNSLTGYNGLSTTKTNNNQNSCLKFYKYAEDAATQTMILDHNTTATVAWNSSGNVLNGPSTATEKQDELLGRLKSDTDGWKGTIEPVNYTDPTGYTVIYSDYKARLITKAELDSLSIPEIGTNFLSEIGWLFDRTSPNCKTSYDTSGTCLNNANDNYNLSGYWTMSADTGDYGDAWSVYYDGTVNYVDISNSNSVGVRPVITIKK